MKKFTYKMYKNSEMKKVLENLFQGKCAYCETYYGAAHPMEVEHYRPKKIVIIRLPDGQTQERYGYYWLGSNWHNLLPSCIECNRLRNHEDLDGQLIPGGKKNFFPLKDENMRALNPGDEVAEDDYRLLLDPCRDDPAEHLKFIEDGVIQPVVLDNGDIDQMGEESIRVYGLWRRWLTKFRKEKYLEIRGCIKKIERHRKVLNNIIQGLELNPDDELRKMNKELIEEGLAEHIEELFQYQEAHKEYSGMAKQIIAKYFPDFV
jgi:uncharacterized protein (TIGR02646 family)